MEATVRQFRAKLSSYLKYVQHGQEVLVTSHHHPIARLVPILEEETAKRPSLQTFLQDVHQLQKRLQSCGVSGAVSQLLKQRSEERY